MPITTTDIQTRFSVTSGAAGDTTVGTAAGSLGKYVSTTLWADGDPLFDDVSGAENTAQESEYRCVFIVNAHATLTALGTRVYIDSQVPDGCDVALAVDNLAASDKASAAPQAASVVNENTAPTGVGVFSAPTDAATGISLGDLAPGQARAVWIKRTAKNTAALNGDGFVLGIVCDTEA